MTLLEYAHSSHCGYASTKFFCSLGLACGLSCRGTPPLVLITPVRSSTKYRVKSFTGASGAANLKGGAGKKKYRCVCGGAGKLNATTQRKTDAFPITDGGGVWRSEWTSQQAAVISVPSQPGAAFHCCPFFMLTLRLQAVWGRLGKGPGGSYVSIVEKHTGMLWVGHRAVVEDMKVCEKLR